MRLSTVLYWSGGSGGGTGTYGKIPTVDAAGALGDDDHKFYYGPSPWTRDWNALIAMNSGTDDINETLLPETKADSMDMEDEIVGIQTRMSADLNQFTDTLTRALQVELAEIPMESGNSRHLISLARYERDEKNATKEFFKDKKSGLSDIYKGIEDEAKAQMASEMLLMTADPNYIADPSEARAALVKPSQRNKFRYAALIQQEKNKQLKLKYALKIKRKQQMVDLAKKQAYIRASIFRASAAKHELEHLLKKADESVKIDGGSSAGNPGNNQNNQSPPIQ
jgi:hypothetical protein